MTTEMQWVELGEGLYGEYDPNDPQDIELLRLDRLENGEVVESWCTNVPVAISPFERVRLLNLALAAYNDGVEFDVLSWMDETWTENSVRSAAKRLTHLGK